MQFANIELVAYSSRGLDYSVRARVLLKTFLFISNLNKLLYNNLKPKLFCFIINSFLYY